ncbi:MAG: heme exporter protein CcmB [Actinomycetota bacterium]|nr:heme exporter protein CcmB [Actinomycetota bacterium]
MARAGMSGGYVADVAALARKDLLLELRTRDTVPAMLLFVVGALVVFHFALPEGSSRVAAAGMLWIALLFTALLALVRGFVAERDDALIDGLILAPCDRSAIWLGKTLSVLAFLLFAEAVALPAFALFYEPLSWELVAGVALANVGIASVGTLLGAMAAAARARELLLPLLFLPVAIPLIVGGVGATLADDPGRYLGFLGLYDLIFAILSWATFEYVVTE